MHMAESPPDFNLVGVGTENPTMKNPPTSASNLIRQPISAPAISAAATTIRSHVMNTKIHLPVLLLTALLAMLPAISSRAATITQVQSNTTSGQSWLNPGSWSNGAVPIATNEYISGSGMVLRSPTTTNSTFSGSSLTMNGSQFNATGATGADGAITIADFRVTNGTAIVNGNGGNRTQTINGGTLAVSGSAFIRLNTNSTTRSINIDSQLTGSGNIGLIQTGTLTLNGIGNTFNGTWIVGGAMTVLGTTYTNSASLVSILNAASASSLGIDSNLVANAYSVIRIGYDWETNGDVTLNLNSLTYLDTNWTVGSLTINGFSLGAGTYSYDYLNTNFDAYFNTTGLGGSITVVPEPGSLCLMAMAAGMAILRKRVRRNAGN